MKRKHDQSVNNGAPEGQVRQPGLGVQPEAVQPENGGYQVQGGRGGNRAQRKQCFGASKIVATGRADWAAPVEVFVSNTSPDLTENEVKEILKLCADDAKTGEGNEYLADFAVKDAKCLTRPELENPRTKCWRVSVPFKFKEFILSDMAYPMGWCHRPFYPPKQKSKEEIEAEQLAKRAKQNNM